MEIYPDGTTSPERLWRSQIQAWEKTPGQSCRETGARKKTAPGYVEKNSLRHAERVQSVLKGLELKPHYRILDIGAGAGTLTIPMAEKVRQVTAVEPSPTMHSALTDYVVEQGITNISCVQRAWEDPDIMDHLEPPYDMVVASLSLGMPDIKDAVKKMETVSCGDIVLYWHAGTPGWETMPRALWPTLFKERYHGGPKSDLLFLVLYEMGIYPCVDALACRFEIRFASVDAAVNHYAEKFCITDRTVIQKSLISVLIPQGDEWVHPIDHAVMKFQWRAGRRMGINDKKAIRSNKEVSTD